MTGRWTSHLILWLADVYVLSSLLLLLALAAFVILRQPARRMTVARAAALGLVALAILSAIPGWPRHSWRMSWLPGEEKVVSSPARSLTPIAGSRGAMPDRPHWLARPAFVATSSPVQNVSPQENPGQERAAAEPIAEPIPLAASSAAVQPSWTALIVAAFVVAALLSLAWLLIGAVQAALLCCRSEEAPDSLVALLRESISGRERVPRLRLSSRIAHPVAIGVLRPMILLPEQFVANESEDRIRTALAHESAHIGNGDLGLLALCRLLLPLFHAQPLFWLLRRQIRLDQEVLADAAAASSDRTLYAEILLDWARTMAVRPAGSYAAALGLWERPSQLRRRIALLLDEKRAIEQRSPHRWRLAAWGIGGMLVLGLSLGSIRSGTGRIDSSHELEEPAADGVSVVFQGRVLDPEGKPFPGARIYLDYFVWKEYSKGIPPRLRATTGADGRFRFLEKKAYFSRPPVLEPWRWAHVVAMADGFGLGVSDSDEDDYGRELTVRMPRDDAPISGRLLDLEGRPVAGATVRADAVAAPPGGDLAPFLNAARNSRLRIYELQAKYLPKEIRFFPHWQPIPTVTTGPDGRFLIRGIGRERQVYLGIEGPTIRWTNISALTRAFPPTDIVQFYRRKDPEIERYYGASFDLNVAPSRPYEGVVRDRDSGVPVPGVTIQSARIADSNYLHYRPIKTTTDKEGRFHLTGMPLGAGNEVAVIPAEDQPYLLSQFKLPDSGGLKPVHIDLGLKRGIWLRGRITDRATGKPVEASVRYSAAISNPQIDQVSGIGDVQYNGNDVGSSSTREDGTFQIAVLPGPGLLTVRAQPGEVNYTADESAAAKPLEAAFRPYPYGLGDAWAELDVGDSPASRTHDFALSPVVNRTVTGLIFDPEGKPLTGARYYGLYDMPYWYPIERTNGFTVADLTRPRPRTLPRLFKIRDLDTLRTFLLPEDTRPVAIVHQGKRLAGFTEVGWSTPEPVRVQLQPWGTLIGRVVDADGQPRADFGIQPKITFKNRVRNDRIDHFVPRVFTDQAGQLRVEGLVPSLSYRLVFENASGFDSGQGLDVEPLNPGETRDLGEIKAVISGESN